MPGPRPKPTALRLVKSESRLPKGEPKPKIELIEPPEDLRGAALEEWRRVAPELYSLGLLSKIDRATLGAYCSAEARRLSAMRAILAERERDLKRKRGRMNSDGLLIRTKSGNIIQNPAVGILRRAEADVVKYAIEFGMTPAARSRIDVEKARTEDPTGEFLD